jgi:hypothetical protein
MALFYECMLKCARKLLDTADIVRDAMLRQQSGVVEIAAYRSEDYSAHDVPAPERIFIHV